MAKKQQQQVKAKPKVQKKKKSMNAKILFLLLMFFIACILFFPTTFVLFFGLMPTWASLAMDNTKGRLKSLAVGMVNFAGCTYVLMKLWTKNHSIEYAVELMLNPESLIVMYCVAGAGFAIQSVTMNVVTKISLQRTKDRVEKIEKEQKVLQERWGYEVSGKVPLDSYGFPITDNE